MARMSSEAKAAAVWRVGASLPVAPASLSTVARQLWDQIVADRPPDQFRPGSYQLLAGYCEASVMIERLMRRPPKDLEGLALLQMALQRHAILAERLGLTPSARLRNQDGLREERAGPTGRLLGGHATKS